MNQSETDIEKYGPNCLWLVESHSFLFLFSAFTGMVSKGENNAGRFPCSSGQRLPGRAGEKGCDQAACQMGAMLPTTPDKSAWQSMPGWRYRRLNGLTRSSETETVSELRKSKIFYLVFSMSR
jgi:hypothetical protein